MTIYNTSSTPSSFSSFIPWLLPIIWFMVEASIFLHYGIVQSTDSPLYISDAHGILQGYLPADRGIWYSSYSLFLAFVFFIGEDVTTVVVLQMLFSAFAAFALYKVVDHLLNNATAAFLAVLQYLLWINIHQWDAYIHTESLFTSFSILSFASLVMGSKKGQRVLTVVLIAFTFFIRPTGISFLAGVAGYGLFKIQEQKTGSKKNLILCSFVLLVLLIFLMNEMLRNYIFYFIDSYSKAEIIYPGIPFGIEPPAHLHIPSVRQEPLIQLFLFILCNPFYFLKLFLIKAFLFVASVKPYFSMAHNLLIVAFLYPIYALALYGYKKLPASGSKTFILCYLCMQALTVSLTSENWDGRFLIPLLPFVFICSATGMSAGWECYKQKKSPGTL